MAENTGTDWYNISKESMKAQLGVGEKYKQKSNLEAIVDPIQAQIAQLSTQAKAEEKRLKKARNTKATELKNFVKYMDDDSFRELGKESYAFAQEEVDDLRQQMFAAIDAKDPKLQQELMTKLNDIKSRHVNDAEAHKTLIESWEDDSADEAAMTEEDIDIMTQFMTNKTKKAVYTNDDPPKLMYQWNKLDKNNEQIPMRDNNGKQVFDENGEPMYETESYSAEDLQNRVLIKESENGMKYMDYVEQLKNDWNAEAFPSDSRVLEKVEEIIPAEKKALRSWLHSNPSDSDGLNVHEYLVDLMDNYF